MQARLRRLLSFVNLDPAITKRRAVLLRDPPWPNGKVSQRMRQDYLDRGGMLTTVSADDLRTFAALAILLDEHDPALPDWLLARRPAGNTALFARVFGPPPDDGQVQKPEPDEPGGPARSSADAEQPATPDSSRPSLEFGTVSETGESVRVPFESLRKHAVIFAGSGSGKTVLIRRLIEECALNGVSAIVLDPNNDLARLGDPWPEPPKTWRPGDAERAATYLDGTDVVVWTPRRTSGRPVSFQPLPDFSAVLTQFYGFLNSPVQIAAAREVASAKGSAVLEISRLEAGQFYTVGEGTPFRKVSVPMCLSYHPASALSTEEVLARARQ